MPSGPTPSSPTLAHVASGLDRRANGRTGETTPPETSQCVDWYHDGKTRTVEINGVRVTVRVVGRQARRTRIAIIAPAGASFS